MIKFKTVKRKHRRWANQVLMDLGLLEGQRDMTPAETVEAEDRLFKLAMSMVDSWDFTDAETGQPIPVSEESIGELTDEQVTEVVDGFNALMDGTTIPKTNAGAASSGRGPRKPAKSTKTPPTG